jgi:hypothetical protein
MIWLKILFFFISVDVLAYTSIFGIFYINLIHFIPLTPLLYVAIFFLGELVLVLPIFIYVAF